MINVYNQNFRREIQRIVNELSVLTINRKNVGSCLLHSKVRCDTALVSLTLPYLKHCNL